MNSNRYKNRKKLEELDCDIESSSFDTTDDNSMSSILGYDYKKRLMKLKYEFESTFFSTIEDDPILPIRECHEPEYPGKHVRISLDLLNGKLYQKLPKVKRDMYEFRLTVGYPVPFFLILSKITSKGEYSDLFATSFSSEWCNIDILPKHGKTSLSMMCMTMKYSSHYVDFWDDYVKGIVEMINCFSERM